MNIQLKSLVVGSILGAIIFNIAVYSIGFTSAITLPSAIANWATENSVVFSVLFVWDLFVVQLLGIGILAALATYLLLRFSSLIWLYTAIGFVATETLISYSWLFNPLYHQHFSKNSSILLFSHFIVVCICVFIAARLARNAQVTTQPIHN
ncbi:MAG: hypothetical protein AAGC78_17030 [Cellvibrio sp.]|uniref:hypothetical protein n=1 Tax=Cellvibrio sp. TaxID=1965322 RepID=UPI0031A5CDF1